MIYQRIRRLQKDMVLKMREELRKLFRGRLTCGLILLSVIINTYLLFMQKDKTETLRLIDDFCIEHGSSVSDEKMEVLAELWNKTDTNDITWEEFQNNVESVAGYFQFVQSGDMAGAYCTSRHLSGKAAEYVRAQFHRLDGAIREAAGQELAFFPPYRMHIFDFISTYLLYAVNWEGIVIAVIVTLYCVDFERSSHTISTVYSTRKGKKVIRDKLFASVVGSMICFLIISAITFLLAGCVFPMKTIVNTEVSNPLVNLKGAPCVAMEPMTIGKYILLSLGISCRLAVIYSLGSFCLGLRAGNGYYAFGIFVMLLGGMKVISAAAPTSACIFFWTQYNPLDMALKAGTWLLYGAGNFSPPGYEGATAALWLIACAAGCIFGLRSVERGLYRKCK